MKVALLALFAAFALLSTVVSAQEVTATECKDNDEGCHVDECSFSVEYAKTSCAKTCNVCESRTIKDAIYADARFSKLKTHMVDSGLDTTLASMGNTAGYRFFAPTDDAIVKAVALGLPENFGTEYMTYHYANTKKTDNRPNSVGSQLLVGDTVATVYSAETTAGANLVTIYKVGDDLQVNNAKMGQEILADNGIIVPIDDVLIPPKMRNNVNHIAANPNKYGTFYAAAMSIRVLPSWAAHATLTFFVPTNEAFAALPALPVGLARKHTLQYHVLNSVVRSTDIRNNARYTTQLGRPVTFTVNNGRVRIAEATVIEADAQTLSGVVHQIDKVLAVPECADIDTDCSRAAGHCELADKVVNCVAACELCLVADCEDIFDGCNAASDCSDDTKWPNCQKTCGKCQDRTPAATPAPTNPGATPAPVAPVTPAPVAPVTPAPVAPVTPAPRAPVTPAPVAPVTPAPAAPVTPAPAAATTPAPVALTTPAPTAPVDSAAGSLVASAAAVAAGLVLALAL